MLRVHVQLVIAGFYVVLVKGGVDVPGNRKPAERVGPQVAQIGLRLSGGVLCA